MTMKKIYISPKTGILENCIEAAPLMSSDPSNRNVEGTPTSDGLPKGVGDTETTENPFTDEDGNDKGQGGGSGTTRSKSGMIWDEW